LGNYRMAALKIFLERCRLPTSFAIVVRITGTDPTLPSVGYLKVQIDTAEKTIEYPGFVLDDLDVFGIPTN